MTTDEKDAILGSLMRQRSQASRDLKCLEVKLALHDRQYMLARAVISLHMRPVIVSEGHQVGHWDNPDTEPLDIPDVQSLFELMEKITSTKKHIEHLAEQISGMAPC